MIENSQQESSESFSSKTPTKPEQALSRSEVQASLNLIDLEQSRYVGTIFNTYFIYEKGDEVILVDQHAAHERIQYEKLKRKFFGKEGAHEILHAQTLLIPEAIRVTTDNQVLLQNQLKQISKFGFEAELQDKGFQGEGDCNSTCTVVFSTIPAEWGLKQFKPRLRNLVDRLISFSPPTLDSTEQRGLDSSIVLDEALFELIASEACHSSVRAGDLLEIEETEHLVDLLFQCEHPWNCPHGRPTLTLIPKRKFAEWFQR